VLAAAPRSPAVELREATVPVLAEAENALADAAFELASAVVGAALADRVAAARAAVERVLAAADGGAVPIVRLHPADIDALGGTGFAAEGMRLVADPALSRGDAVGELPGGWLDGRIDEALARAKEALR
jgi:flagellar assembly protein FliH